MDIENILELISNNLFGLICHQNSSFLVEIDGKCVMLCPRCSGLHIGFFISLIYFSVRKTKRIKLTGLIPKLFCLLGLILITLEWTLAQFSIVSSTITSRLVTGLIAGSVICILALLYIRNYVLKLNSGENFSSISILVVTCISLIAGLTFFYLKSWSLITFTLICVVLFNLSFLSFSILHRFLSLVKYKTIKP